MRSAKQGNYLKSTKNGVTGPYPTTYILTRNPNSNPNSANRYPHQYLVLGKLNAFKSGVQDKLYETYKTDLSEKRDFDNEILRWQTKWSHSTDEKPVTLRETLQQANPDLYPRSQLLPSSSQCQCQLLPPNDVLARCAEWRRTYVPRWKQSDSQHLPRCMLTEIAIDVEAVILEFCAKKNRRLALEFLWVPPRFQLCLQLRHYLVAVVKNNHSWLHFAKYSIISCSIWNPGICQLI